MWHRCLLTQTPDPMPLQIVAQKVIAPARKMAKTIVEIVLIKFNTTRTRLRSSSFTEPSLPAAWP